MYFARPIHAIVLTVEALQFLTQDLVTDSAVLHRVAFDRPMAATGDKPAHRVAQHATDSLDPEMVTICIHLSDHLVVARSSLVAEKQTLFTKSRLFAATR